MVVTLNQELIDRVEAAMPAGYPARVIRAETNGQDTLYQLDRAIPGLDSPAASRLALVCHAQRVAYRLFDGKHFLLAWGHDDNGAQYD